MEVVAISAPGERSEADGCEWHLFGFKEKRGSPLTHTKIDSLIKPPNP